MRSTVFATFIALSFTTASGLALAEEAAFVWVSKPRAAAYEEAGAYSHNPSGQPIQIARAGVGQYEVRFGGLARVARGGNVQVTAYGAGPEHCNVVRWVSKAQDLSIAVRCFAGQKPSDTQFTLLFTPGDGRGQPTPPPVTTPPPPPPKASLSLRPAGDTPIAGNPRGGNSYRDACPAGMVITGVQAHVAGSLEGIQLVCSRMQVRPDGSGVDISGARMSPVRGRARGQRARSDCPSQHVVIGFDGRSGQLVDRLTLRCASLRVDHRGRLVVDQQRSSASVGKSGGRPFPLRRCPRNTVATTGVIQAGNSVDAFGLGCSSMTITR